METQDLRTLKILEKVDNTYSPSQRDLARELNISLGLVNSFIKRLAHKGYVKVTTIPRKRIQYILTPKGMAEKSRLTYHYIQSSYQYYRQARQKLQELFRELETQGVQRVVFHGASDLAEIAFLSLQETGINLVAVVDDRKPGKRLLGHQIIESRELGGASFDRIVITEDGTRDPMLDRLMALGIPRDKIVFVE
jgi:DNA-binding MarR family transcriptional regulator